MQAIYQYTYQQIYFDPSTKFMKQVWLPTTKKIDESDFKNQMLEMFRWVKSEKPAYFLGNTQELFFAIDPLLQDWVNENINLKSENIKAAFLVSQDFYAQLGLSQTIDDLLENEIFKQNPKDIAFFPTEEEAIQWLFS